MCRSSRVHLELPAARRPGKGSGHEETRRCCCLREPRRVTGGAPRARAAALAVQVLTTNRLGCPAASVEMVSATVVHRISTCLASHGLLPSIGHGTQHVTLSSPGAAQQPSSSSTTATSEGSVITDGRVHGRARAAVHAWQAGNSARVTSRPAGCVVPCNSTEYRIQNAIVETGGLRRAARDRQNRRMTLKRPVEGRARGHDALSEGLGAASRAALSTGGGSASSSPPQTRVGSAGSPGRSARHALSEVASGSTPALRTTNSSRRSCPHPCSPALVAQRLEEQSRKTGFPPID